MGDINTGYHYKCSDVFANWNGNATISSFFVDRHSNFTNMSNTICDIKENSPSLSEAAETEPLDWYTAKIKEKLLLLEKSLPVKFQMYHHLKLFNKSYSVAVSFSTVRFWSAQMMKHLFFCLSSFNRPKCDEKDDSKQVRYISSFCCQHNTRSHNSTWTEGKKTKNTNCPFSMTLKIHNEICKNKRPETSLYNKDFPCEIHIRYKHNHSTDVLQALSFRAVSESTKK